MEETKKCPYCGEEILAIAKKCKHCGEWLNNDEEHNEVKKMVPCPICGEMIEEGEINRYLKKSLKVYQERRDHFSILLKEMINNVEEIENMEGKAVQIKENADLFNKNANNLRKAAWWSNCKWTIILILVIILLLIIILPISISVGKKKKDDDKEKKNNTTRILYFND